MAYRDISELKDEFNKAVKMIHMLVGRAERNLCIHCSTLLAGRQATFNCVDCGHKMDYYVHSLEAMASNATPLDRECTSDPKRAKMIHTHFSCECGDTVLQGVVRYSQAAKL